MHKCTACGRTPVDLHHVTSRGAGGKDTEDNLMPLCRSHHQEWHRIGPVKFFERYSSVHFWLRKMGRHDVLSKKSRLRSGN